MTMCEPLSALRGAAHFENAEGRTVEACPCGRRHWNRTLMDIYGGLGLAQHQGLGAAEDDFGREIMFEVYDDE